MADANVQHFLVDCNRCQAKVSATQTGSAHHDLSDHEEMNFDSVAIYVGNCPRCGQILVGRSEQTGFENLNAYEDSWSEPTRVYPSPTRTLSFAVPKEVRHSVNQAEKCLQVGAYDAACVMFGRALESLCNDVIGQKEAEEAAAATAAGSPLPKALRRPIMLRSGLDELFKRKVIDQRLLDWSTQLQAFRNMSAHAGDVTITRQDATDLQTFGIAIVEYIYDLSQRYEEFAGRAATKRPKKP